MQSLQDATPEMIVRFTQIDYDKEMAFVAVTETEELGVGRYIMNPDGNSADFALVVSDKYHGMGIGFKIMRALMQSAKHKGIFKFEGEVLTVNKPMLSLVKKLGFSIEPIEGDSTVMQVAKDLRQ
jgi:acetyltransferase